MLKHQNTWNVREAFRKTFPIISLSVSQIFHFSFHTKSIIFISGYQEASKALFGSFYGSNVFHSNPKDAQSSNGGHTQKIETTTEKFTWGYQTIPTLYSVYQKVEIFPPFLMFIVNPETLFFMYYAFGYEFSFGDRPVLVA